MSNFVSLMDVVHEKLPLTPVKEDIIRMKSATKELLDQGLTPAEMQNAKTYYNAIIAAEEILDKLANQKS